MTPQHALELVNRMRAAFPAWDVWVQNKSANPQATFAEYSRAVKPLPRAYVSAAVDEMVAAPELPTYSSVIPELLRKAQAIQYREAGPTDEERQRLRVAFESQRKDRNERQAAPGTSRRAMLQIAEIWEESEDKFPGDLGGYYPSGHRTPRGRYVSERAEEIWRQIDADRLARTPHNGDQPDEADVGTL